MRHRTSTMTAYYANRALSHSVWTIGITIGVVTMKAVAGVDGALTAVWGAWVGFEFLRAGLSVAKSVSAGRVERQVPTFSVREGKFVSIDEEDAL